MNLIKRASKETHEILNNARTAYINHEITKEQYNEIVMSCFRAEVERQYLKPIADKLPVKFAH